MSLLRRLVGRSAETAVPREASVFESTSPEAFIRAAFWIVLGREVTPIEFRDQLREIQSGDRHDRHVFLLRLLASAECSRGLSQWKDNRDRHDDPSIEEAALAGLGSDDQFVKHAYEMLLGRPADEQGLRHYAGALAEGDTRSHVLRSLAVSEEFERRHREVAPQGGFLPRDTQLCELANPAKWDNPEWMSLLRDLKVVPSEKESMHRKGYEFTQLLYGLTRLGRLRESTRVLSVGAGHEAILYWLANHVGSVVATDVYEEGRWEAGGQEGDERVIRQPHDYAPFPYREDRLVFLKMDGRHLAFPAATFDVAYSLSSIEHFGGLLGAAAAVDEMARVVKPGGLIVLATEYMLSGTPNEEVFQPAQVRELVARPGLRLVQPIDEDVYRRYEYVAVDLYKNRYQTPHMVVQMGGTVFTTVMFFLERS
jgi:SAM-dependent methyltransferase